LQGSVIVALAAALVWLWRSAAAYPLKAAALCLATILATPYSFDYDMMVLAPAITFLAVDGIMRGFGPWEKTMLAALWLVPLVARSVAEASLIPLGVPAMLAVFVMVLRRAASDFTKTDFAETDIAETKTVIAKTMAFSGPPSTVPAGSSGTARGHDIAAFKL
jgi:hypothetical protein